MPFAILLVGTGDVGRTPLAAALIERELRRTWPRAADDVRIATAGFAATPGSPPAPHLETVAARRGIAVDEHRAAPLDAASVVGADLVLTMTRQQRAQLVLAHPRARTRVFALLEFLALADSAVAMRGREPAGRGDRLETRLGPLVRLIASRKRAIAVPEDERRFDLFDPYGYSLEVYDRVADALEGIARALVTDLAVLLGTKHAGAATRTA